MFGDVDLQATHIYKMSVHIYIYTARCCPTEADKILVVENGQIRETGTHEVPGMVGDLKGYTCRAKQPKERFGTVPHSSLAITRGHYTP